MDYSQRRDLTVVEDAADAKNYWLASIIDSAMDAIITVDDEQNIVLFNKSAETVFGVPAGRRYRRVVWIAFFRIVCGILIANTCRNSQDPALLAARCILRRS